MLRSFLLFLLPVPFVHGEKRDGNGITWLHPGGGTGRLGDDDLLKEGGGLTEALGSSHQGIFVFDADGTVIASEAQGGDDLLPGFGTVAVAAGAEEPGTLFFLGVRLGVQNSDDARVHVVDFAVLGVNVEDRVAEHANGVGRVDALPPQVAGIEVDADLWAAGDTQFPSRFGIVDQKAGMGLQRHADLGRC